MPTPRPERLTDTVTLYEGDCLDVLPTLEPGSVDAVITDPQQAANRRREMAAVAVWETRRAELIRLYHHLEWPQAKVAAHLGVSQSGLAKAMRRLGIQPRGSANCGQRNGRLKDGKQSRLYRRVVKKDRCRLCGCCDDLGIHHKNDDHYDNRPENLEVLCNSCHMSETKRKWWAAKNAGLPTPKSNGPIGWGRKAGGDANA